MWLLGLQLLMQGLQHQLRGSSQCGSRQLELNLPARLLSYANSAVATASRNRRQALRTLLLAYRLKISLVTTQSVPALPALCVGPGSWCFEWSFIKVSYGGYYISHSITAERSISSLG